VPRCASRADSIPRKSEAYTSDQDGSGRRRFIESTAALLASSREFQSRHPSHEVPELHQNLHQTISVRDRSSQFGTDREAVGKPLTRYYGLRRTVANERSALAKVGVAGSNPVVRSRSVALEGATRRFFQEG